MGKSVVKLFNGVDHLRSLVTLQDGSHVVVDTCFALDICCYETMVFASDEKGSVTCWSELDVERYATVKEISCIRKK